MPKKGKEQMKHKQNYSLLENGREIMSDDNLEKLVETFQEIVIELKESSPISTAYASMETIPDVEAKYIIFLDDERNEENVLEYVIKRNFDEWANPDEEN